MWDNEWSYAALIGIDTVFSLTAAGLLIFSGSFNFFMGFQAFAKAQVDRKR